MTPSLATAAATIPALLLKSISHNTMKRYAQGFRSWNKWRRSHPDIPPLPVVSDHLSIFIAAAIQSNKRFGHVDTVVCGLGWLHKTIGLPNPTLSPTVVALKEAAKRILSRPTKKKVPISPSDLKKLAKKLRHSTLHDLRTLTVAILSYAGFLRFDEVSTLRRSCISFHASHVKLFIVESKTDQHRIGDHVFIARTGSSTCPVAILKSYLKRGNVRSGFIFRGLQRVRDSHVLRKKDKPVSYSTVRKDILKAIADAGLKKSKFGTHSMRRGGATQAANSGVSDRLFKRHGRWKSDKAKDGYVEEDLSTLLSVSRSLGI